MRSQLRDYLFGRLVDPDSQRVVKFLPSNPPAVGDTLLVDGVRCRVTISRVKWNGREWRIKALRVREIAG